MLLSLTVYTGSAIILALLGWHVNHREQRLLAQGGRELPFYSWEIMTAIAIYVLVSSVRWLVSWDYNMYYNYYICMQSLGIYSRENFEPGFSLITHLMSKAGLHFAFFFGFWAALHIVLLYYALRHHKMLLPWIALCIFLGPYYIQWMNTIRQSVAECLFIIMVEVATRRKFWIYLLLTLALTMIHKMSIFLLPLYFVPLVSFKWVKQWMPCVLLVACGVLGQFPQWIQWIFESLGSLASLLGYGHYYRLFASHNVVYTFGTWFGPARVFPFITCFFFIWYYPSMKKAFQGDALLSASYRFALIHIGFLNLFANTTLYMRRPGDLLRGTFLVMVCYTLHYLWRERKWLPLAVMALLNFYYIFYEIYKATFSPSTMNTPEMYHTFLF